MEFFTIRAGFNKQYMFVENFKNQNAAAPFFKDVSSIQKVAESRLPTEIGEFRIAGYRSLISDEEFVVLYKGEFDADVPTLVRIHSQ
ncbi:MAG TPA: hypothetical protein VNB22_17030, partial [Pyrinomonadaceae bacterium]|nr:hypothetical protein [Pyrinomonadaceae bacterium]